MPRVAVAASSQIAADAGATTADEGGNAVDAAVAASIVSCITEPGVCALGAGGFITVADGDGAWLTLDGYVEMPGRVTDPSVFGGGVTRVSMAYGGGTTTLVGPGSVGTPGAVAAWAQAVERFGAVPWGTVLMPAIHHARVGFPLPQASYNYLVHALQPVFGWDSEGVRSLQHGDGRMLGPGDQVHIPHLADTLEHLARVGPGDFYRGDIARAIVTAMEDGGGLVSAVDLDQYRVEMRRPLEVGVNGWRVATNPPPAVGGLAMAAIIAAMGGHPRQGWTSPEVARLVDTQHAVFGYRRDRLDLSDDLDTEAAVLLAASSADEVRRWLSAPSTVHTSAVDDDGRACSITMSAGYGSGMMPPGTGIWMNNCLGELELNRKGLHAQAPGTRLLSNMAPTVAAGADGSVLALGSPGADRITSATSMVLLNFARLGMSLSEAIAHPRLHVEETDDRARVAVEPGLPVDRVSLPVRRFADLSMFFGGASAALWNPATGFEAAADPRRTGGTAIGGR